jgi:hypothetical protein
MRKRCGSGASPTARDTARRYRAFLTLSILHGFASLFSVFFFNIVAVRFSLLSQYAHKSTFSLSVRGFTSLTHSLQ